MFDPISLTGYEKQEAIYSRIVLWLSKQFACLGGSHAQALLPGSPLSSLLDTGETDSVPAHSKILDVPSPTTPAEEIIREINDPLHHPRVMQPFARAPLVYFLIGLGTVLLLSAGYQMHARRHVVRASLHKKLADELEAVQPKPIEIPAERNEADEVAESIEVTAGDVEVAVRVGSTADEVVEVAESSTGAIVEEPVASEVTPLSDFAHTAQEAGSNGTNTDDQPSSSIPKAEKARLPFRRNNRPSTSGFVPGVQGHSHPHDDSQESDGEETDALPEPLSTAPQLPVEEPTTMRSQSTSVIINSHSSFTSDAFNVAFMAGHDEDSSEDEGSQGTPGDVLYSLIASVSEAPEAVSSYEEGDVGCDGIEDSEGDTDDSLSYSAPEPQSLASSYGNDSDVMDRSEDSSVHVVNPGMIEDSVLLTRRRRTTSNLKSPESVPTSAGDLDDGPSVNESWSITGVYDTSQAGSGNNYGEASVFGSKSAYAAHSGVTLGSGNGSSRSVNDSSDMAKPPLSLRPIVLKDVFTDNGQTPGRTRVDSGSSGNIQQQFLIKSGRPPLGDVSNHTVSEAPKRGPLVRAASCVEFPSKIPVKVTNMADTAVEAGPSIRRRQTTGNLRPAVTAKAAKVTVVQKTVKAATAALETVKKTINRKPGVATATGGKAAITTAAAKTKKTVAAPTTRPSGRPTDNTKPVVRGPRATAIAKGKARAH
ncbi:hypothetical protein BC629DRAFT_1447378 [Irpex lacteus]|nr:hypothetical protein BC629DRAFT_1447378 [Irpex lacteus]